MIDPASKPDPALYRPCVGVMMVNPHGMVFVGKRIDGANTDFWQMPQGGVDPGENLAEAAFRELHEETGVEQHHLELVATMEDEIFYDLPDELKGRMWGGRYLGQRQRWFLVRFTGADADVDLNAHKHPEFCEWRWVDPARLPDMIVPFKRAVYETVVAALAPRI